MPFSSPRPCAAPFGFERNVFVPILFFIWTFNKKLGKMEERGKLPADGTVADYQFIGMGIFCLMNDGWNGMGNGIGWMSAINTHINCLSPVPPPSFSSN
jgi:hypothetical protein